MDRPNGFPFGNGANGSAQDRSSTAALRRARFHRAVLQACTPDDVQAIARMLVRLSSSGDLAAARLLLSYTIGKPTARARPTSSHR